MSDSETESVDKNIKNKSKKLAKKSLETQSILSEDTIDDVTICEWFSYNGKRCKRESKGRKYCKLHRVLIKDFNFLKKDNEEVCSSESEFKIIPRSKERPIMVFLLLKLEKLWYNCHIKY